MKTDPQFKMLNMVAFLATLIHQGMDPLDAIAFVSVAAIAPCNKKEGEYLEKIYKEMMDQRKGNPPEEDVKLCRRVYTNFLMKVPKPNEN